MDAISSTNLQIKTIASNDITNNIWINSHVILNGKTALNDNVLVGGTLTVSNGKDLKVDSIAANAANYIAVKNDIVSTGSIEVDGNVVAGVDVVTNSISKKSTATHITMQDDVMIAGGLQVDGTITGYTLNVADINCTALFGPVRDQLKAALNPFWVAGKVDGTTLTKYASTGRYDFTVSRPGTNPTGAYKITFAIPASSDHYVISVNQQAAGVAKIWEYSTPTSTDCHLVTYNTSKCSNQLYILFFSFCRNVNLKNKKIKK
jgi:hypothetical protein